MSGENPARLGKTHKIKWVSDANPLTMRAADGKLRLVGMRQLQAEKKA
jgi:hypothetical protein